MLLLIVEVLLTVAAWRKGWKGWALLPWAVCFFTVFIGGAFIGAAGGPVDEAAIMGLGTLLEIVLLIIPLAVMSLWVPGRKQVRMPESARTVEGEPQEASEVIKV
jgi:hypothetical protein